MNGHKKIPEYQIPENEPVYPDPRLTLEWKFSAWRKARKSAPSTLLKGTCIAYGHLGVSYECIIF
jgi:hypothetical protein